MNKKMIYIIVILLCLVLGFAGIRMMEKSGSKPEGEKTTEETAETVIPEQKSESKEPTETTEPEKKEEQSSNIVDDDGNVEIILDEDEDTFGE